VPLPLAAILAYIGSYTGVLHYIKNEEYREVKLSFYNLNYDQAVKMSCFQNGTQESTLDFAGSPGDDFMGLRRGLTNMRDLMSI
jgi:hypothetical protein